MQTAALTLFRLDFHQDVFLVLGLIYFILFFYWTFSLQDAITSALRSRGAERGWLIFCGVIGLAFGALAAAEWDLPFAGTAFSLGLCIGLALFHPIAAACLLASSLFLRPWELVTENTYLALLPRLSILLCLGHFVLHCAGLRKIDFRWTRFARVLLLFSAWALITTLFAPSPTASQGQFFDGFLKSVVLFFLLLQMVRAANDLRLLIGTLLVSFLFVASVSIYQSVRIGVLSDNPDFRLVGFGAFANSNDVGALMVWILPFTAFLALRKGAAFFTRAFGAALAASALTAILLTRSRGALLGVAAIVVVTLLLRLGRKALVPLVVGIVLLAIPATLFVFNRRAEDLAGSSAGRKTYLKAGLRMGMKNPIFGVGFGAYPEKLREYSTESLEESPKMTAHNSGLLVFAETGVVGFVLFALLFLYAGVSAWKLYPLSPQYLLALVGYGVAIAFLSHSYLIYPYLLFALVETARGCAEHRVPA